jgi:hypothetical protein
MPYIITKDIFGTWKKGKVITEKMVEDSLAHNYLGESLHKRVLTISAVQTLKETGYIKPYKPKK